MNATLFESRIFKDVTNDLNDVILGLGLAINPKTGAFIKSEERKIQGR